MSTRTGECRARCPRIARTSDAAGRADYACCDPGRRGRVTIRWSCIRTRARGRLSGFPEPLRAEKSQSQQQIYPHQHGDGAAIDDETAAARRSDRVSRRRSVARQTGNQLPRERACVQPLRQSAGQGYDQLCQGRGGDLAGQQRQSCGLLPGVKVYPRQSGEHGEQGPVAFSYDRRVQEVVERRARDWFQVECSMPGIPGAACPWRRDSAVSVARMDDVEVRWAVGGTTILTPMLQASGLLGRARSLAA
jgi:hypothetical protein